MELQQLSYFRVVARLEHMTHAAEELDVTQPSLIRAISRLERELGVPLFNRHGRGLHLNQFGVALLGHVDQIFRQVDAATRELRDMAGLEQGYVSLAAGALHWLPEVLQPFLATHPEVLDGYFRRAGITPQVACEADEPGAVEDYVAAGSAWRSSPGSPSRRRGMD